MKTMKKIKSKNSSKNYEVKMPKFKTIKLERLQTLTGYNNVKVGAEIELTENESANEVFDKLNAFVEHNINTIRNEDKADTIIITGLGRYNVKAILDKKSCKIRIGCQNRTLLMWKKHLKKIAKKNDVDKKVLKIYESAILMIENVYKIKYLQEEIEDELPILKRGYNAEQTSKNNI